MENKALSVIDSRNAVSGHSDLIPVAEYMRMSTDHQRYSIEYQCGEIRRYAVQHHMAVVRTYLDDGKSGLSIAGRFGLQALLSDVRNGHADYAAVLVYDISRWGRFQNTDESAYYEYLCKLGGVKVIYCSEQFDDSPMGGLVKNIKRVMAGEFSRNLSVRVWGGQMQAVKAGFRMGGETGFGLRRLLLGPNGTPKGILQRHEWKSVASDRVILIPGPREELEVVWRIFDSCILLDRSSEQIAKELNAIGLAGAPNWTRRKVDAILCDPKYAGENLYNRRSKKLKSPMVWNSEESWIRSERRFQGLVTREYFDLVATLRKARKSRECFPMPIMKKQLRTLLQKHGFLSGALIDAEAGMASSSSYRRKFGSMAIAFDSIGYCPPTARTVSKWNVSMRDTRRQVANDLIVAYQAIGMTAIWDDINKVLRSNSRRPLSIRVIRSHTNNDGNIRWYIRHIGIERNADALLVRLDLANKAIFDLHALPVHALPLLPKFSLSRSTRALVPYKIDSLDSLSTLKWTDQA